LGEDEGETFFKIEEKATQHFRFGKKGENQYLKKYLAGQ